MFKTGDKYIHFTKYGGVNKGEVKWYGETRVINLTNGVQYLEPYIVNALGFSLKLDGTDGRVLKIEKEIEKDQVMKKLTDVMKRKQ